MDMAPSRFRYSAQVFGYVPKVTKEDLRALRKVDSRRYAESQVITAALEAYIPKLKAKLGLTPFNEPAQGTPGRRKRRAA